MKKKSTSGSAKLVARKGSDGVVREYVVTGQNKGRKCTEERKKMARDPKLGKMTDLEMALKYGVSKFVARRVRIECGLSPARKGHNRKVDPRRTIIALDKRLGKVTDSTLSEMLTDEHIDEYVFCRYFVNKVRRDLGIAAAPKEARKRPRNSGWKPSTTIEKERDFVNRQNAKLLRQSNWM
jgi:hypothetical protein